MRIPSLISLFLIVSSVMAQDDFVNKMNEIKLSGKYYTAHSRAEREADAFEACIRDILSQLPTGQHDESSVRSRVKHLSKPGTPCRVFVYLEKENAQPSAPQLSASQPSYVQSPVTQPTVTQPSVPKTVVVREQAVIPTDNSMLPQLVADLKARPTIMNAFNSFGAKKDLGLVSTYGLMKDAADTDAVYIVIYNSASEELRAILTPVSAGYRKNLITDTVDSFDNYHGEMAFWFTLK